MFETFSLKVSREVLLNLVYLDSVMCLIKQFFLTWNDVHFHCLRVAYNTYYLIISLRNWLYTVINWSCPSSRVWRLEKVWILKLHKILLNSSLNVLAIVKFEFSVITSCYVWRCGVVDSTIVFGSTGQGFTS